jgi:hypothetical protein
LWMSPETAELVSAAFDVVIASSATEVRTVQSCFSGADRGQISS